MISLFMGFTVIGMSLVLIVHPVYYEWEKCQRLLMLLMGGVWTGATFVYMIKGFLTFKEVSAPTDKEGGVV